MTVLDVKADIQVIPDERSKRQTGARTGSSILALDGLRGFAALSVVVTHLFVTLTAQNTTNSIHWGWFGPIWGFGATGVILFFVLSGFLLFLPYARAIRGVQPFPSTKTFYFRRALRILPAYWLALALLTFVNWQPFLHQLRGDTRYPVSDVLLHALMLHNWSVDTYSTINVVFWSMAVECQFYLILPLIGFGLMRLTRRNDNRLLLIAAVGGVALLPAYGLLESLVLADVPALIPHLTLLQTLGYLGVFVVGMICAYWYSGRHELEQTTERPIFAFVLRYSGVFALAIAAFLIVLRYVTPSENGGSVLEEHFTWVVYFPLVALMYGALLIATLRHDTIFARLFSIPVLRFLGLISYSLYIWHWPIYRKVISPLADRFGHSSAILTLALYVGLTILITIPAAYVSYRVAERPFMHFRRPQLPYRAARSPK